MFPLFTSNSDAWLELRLLEEVENMNKLSKEAKERIKSNIDKEIKKREDMYNNLSEEDKEALDSGRKIKGREKDI